MSATVLDRLDHLPRRNLTVLALRGISSLVPGGWTNQTSADELIADVLGSDDPELVAQVRSRADALNRSRHEGYRRALSLYDAVNRSQKAAGGLRVLANVAGALPLVKRLATLTPASQTLQAVDLSLKVGAEMLAFTQVNGLPGDSFAAFGASLNEYASEARVRMAALVCFDALLPLGDNAGMASLLPGRGDTAHMTFLRRGVDHWLGWADGLVGELGLSGQRAVRALETTLGPWHGGMEQLATFLDAFTDTYAHTGVQAVARRLVERAAAEI
jgi:hypothetical protein